MNKRFTFLVGLVMGWAEVVPGVSGGTIAFVGGIFERLIGAVKSVDGKAIGYLFRGQFRSFAKRTDIGFLAVVLSGMALGLVTGVFGISYLMENYPIQIWSFFFGLIIASSVYLGLKIPKWNFKIILALLMGIAIAYLITVQAPASGKDALWAFFISGAVAISAMILPGISGSFILLLLGMYPLVLGSAKSFLGEFDLVALSKLVVFGLGCLLGIAGFSRVLSWLFSKFEMTTYALLTGFVFGSLNKIWPWKRSVLGQDAAGNNIDLTEVPFDPNTMKLIREENLSPFHSAVGEAYLFSAILACLSGVLIIFLLVRVEKKIPN